MTLNGRWRVTTPPTPKQLAKQGRKKAPGGTKAKPDRTEFANTLERTASALREGARLSPDLRRDLWAAKIRIEVTTR